MKVQKMSHKMRRSAYFFIGLLLLAAALASAPQGVQAAATAREEVFASPGKAALALVDALRADDRAALQKIFGKQSHDLLSSGDPVADRNAVQHFLRAYEQMHRFRYGDDGRLYLLVGADNWPMPIPLARGAAGWHFDTAAGAQELLFRRIGANENNAIEVCRTIVAAEHVYAGQAHDGNPAGRFARKFLSAPGKQDGLFWPVKPGEPESPIGPLVAAAAQEGYTAGHKGKRAPYHGYYFRILLQSASKPQAADDTAGGFLVLAYPAKFGSSGIMTFVATADGAVYEKDLGAQVPPMAASFLAYRPDKSWQMVQAPPGT